MDFVISEAPMKILSLNICKYISLQGVKLNVHFYKKQAINKSGNVIFKFVRLIILQPSTAIANQLPGH